MAQVLEDMPDVLAYVKNQNLGFYIPYSTKGDERRYLPDFIARVAVDADEPLNLILEVPGEAKKEKGLSRVPVGRPISPCLARPVGSAAAVRHTQEPSMESTITRRGY